MLDNVKNNLPWVELIIFEISENYYSLHNIIMHTCISCLSDSYMWPMLFSEYNFIGKVIIFLSLDNSFLVYCVGPSVKAIAITIIKNAFEEVPTSNEKVINLKISAKTGH